MRVLYRVTILALVLGCSSDDENDDEAQPVENGVPGGASPPSGDCVVDYDCEPEAPSTGDFHDDCVVRINQFRACVCLPPIERNRDGEACADQQAQYDSEESRGAHAGFRDGICDPSGGAQNECPGWRSETQVVEGCMLSMFGEGPPPTEQCSGSCFSEHGHFINMTGDYGSVSCGIYDADGEIWSVQNFHR
jgi:hypothetical protein